MNTFERAWSRPYFFISNRFTSMKGPDGSVTMDAVPRRMNLLHIKWYVNIQHYLPAEVRGRDVPGRCPWKALSKVNPVIGLFDQKRLYWYPYLDCVPGRANPVSGRPVADTGRRPPAVPCPVTGRCSEVPGLWIWFLVNNSNHTLGAEQ